MTWSPITVALPVMQGVQAILVMAYQKVTSATIITNIKDNKGRTWKLILTTLKTLAKLTPWNGRSWTRRSTGCHKDDRGEILEFLLEA